MTEQREEYPSEKRKKRNRRITLGLSLAAAIVVGSWLGWKWYDKKVPIDRITAEVAQKSASTKSEPPQPMISKTDPAKDSTKGIISQELSVPQGMDRTEEEMKAGSSGNNAPPTLAPSASKELVENRKADPKKSVSTSPPKSSNSPKSSVVKVKAKQEPPLQEEVWQHWGAAPYALSRQEACKKAPTAIDGFTMPSAVKEHFKRVLGISCKGRESDAWLTPYQQLEEMWSGGAQPRVMKKVTVTELPVLKSPEGRPYRNGAVAETAKASSWTYVYEGKTYVLYLPDVCFNWTWTVELRTNLAVTRDDCVEVVFRAPKRGGVAWGVASTAGPLPASACNAQRQGNGPWLAWYGECALCVYPIRQVTSTIAVALVESDSNLAFMRRILRDDTAKVEHKHLYAVTEEEQVIRLSTAAWNTVIYFCLDDELGRQSCGIYIRPEDWKGRYRIEIPDTLWQWGSCPV